MNWELIKHKLCRLIATTAILLAGAMVSAAAAGSMPLWAALLGLFASVVLLNAVCGILLGAPSRTVVAEPDGHRVATGSAAVVARLVAELKGFRGKGIIGIAQVTVEEGVAEAQRAAVQLQVVRGGHAA